METQTLLDGSRIDQDLLDLLTIKLWGQCNADREGKQLYAAL